MKIPALAFLAGLVLMNTPLLRAEPLDVGADAPRIASINQDGKAVNLGDLYGKGYVLVYFYPKADTSGCTAQACSLRDSYEDLTKRGVTVVGVSTDQTDAQKAFQAKYTLPFVLLADPEHKVVDAFGVPLRGTMATRQAFLIKGGKIVWRDLQASTAKQAADVLAALDTLGSKAG
jgi:peroxiredoxin Q/BCP